MSSTLRGYDRHKSDYYVTPHRTIERFLRAFTDREPEFRPISILDPCSGGGYSGGDYYAEPYPYALRNIYEQPVPFTTMDIREDSLADIKADFLAYDFGDKRYDLIITNPPFAIAEDIVKKALKLLNPYGRVVMLQRLNWLGSKRRASFWREHKPSAIYMDCERPSFGGTKGTDSIEYAHFVWSASPAEHTEMVFVDDYNVGDNRD